MIIYEQKRYEESIEYLKEALLLSEDKQNKFDCNYDLGNCYEYLV